MLLQYDNFAELLGSEEFVDGSRIMVTVIEFLGYNISPVFCSSNVIAGIWYAPAGDTVYSYKSRE